MAALGRSGVTPRPFIQPIVIPPLLRNNVDEWLANADTDSPTVRQRDAPVSRS